MSQARTIKNKIFDGYKLTQAEAQELYDFAELKELAECADEIRKYFCGDGFDLCSIVNGKSGACPENCKFCAQSKRHTTGVETYPLLNEGAVSNAALYNHNKGVNRFSIVTSGRTLSDGETDIVCKNYKSIAKTCDIFKCASHGLLTYGQFERLIDAGVKRYHCNLEASRNFFPKICTTHTYDDKLTTIRNAQKAGMEVCSGGIFGMGELPTDRIDMAFELRELNVKSVPINILNPIKGTPLGDLPVLNKDEVIRIVAVYRYILPDAAIRMAGGRGLFDDKGEAFFLSGANAAATGDMLTTGGISIDSDKALISKLGFKLK
ncbi:MAG: biotin synthase BioB [Clostridiales bacterium]|jgi:biotin synthase|nr:biotin synthase BioB [Clostridiales bacterium]